MDWNAHKSYWPWADRSQFVICPPHKWHVQVMGAGPELLLIHGAGGASQSWRNLMPLLAQDHRVIAIDLPGQGFTKIGAPNRCGLPQMVQDIGTLCDHEGWQPVTLIGHSAGVAVALELAPKFGSDVIGINAALSKFGGIAGLLFPAMAKALAALPGIAHMFTAHSARPGSVERLLASTGSNLSASEQRFYRALVSDRAHVNGTLAMMAQWDLSDLLSGLEQNTTTTLLVTGSKDATVPPQASANAAKRLPNGQHKMLEGLGHLAHEEDAAAVFDLIKPALPKVRADIHQTL